MAVLNGVRLGAEGSAEEEGWGEMIVVDVGGATTDVHSIGYGYPAGENVIAQGLPEPYAKRTVEGRSGHSFQRRNYFGAGRSGIASVRNGVQCFLSYKSRAKRSAATLTRSAKRPIVFPREKWHSGCRRRTGAHRRRYCCGASCGQTRKDRDFCG